LQINRCLHPGRVFSDGMRQIRLQSADVPRTNQTGDGNERSKSNQRAGIYGLEFPHEDSPMGFEDSWSF
jgi:hypothetical protein